MIYKILCQTPQEVNGHITKMIETSLYPIKTIHIIVNGSLYFYVIFGDIEYIEFAKKHELIEKIDISTVNIR